MQPTSNEVWKPIPGYEGIYEVSDGGRVRSLPRVITRCDGIPRTVEGRVLKAGWGARDYPRVNLMQKAIPVHHLVLLAFVGPRPEGLIIRHLNGNPQDNRLANLAYGTYSENNFDCVRHGRHGKNNRTHCPRGHILEAPNLNAWMWAKGFRTCKACTRARARLQKSPNLDMQAVSDDRYRKIMAGDNQI